MKTTETKNGTREKTILDELAETAKDRVQAARLSVGDWEMRRRAEEAAAQDTAPAFRFEQSLKLASFGFICEVKKASPSKGVISEKFPYLTIAREYETAGATALSVLTEPSRFLGSDTHLAEIAKAVSLPVLRKDFTVDSYQIYEAKILGASAVLLICSLLAEAQLTEYIGICDRLGISALVEAHDAEEIALAIRAGARIIGINNRDLKTFHVDTSRSAALRSLVPPEILFVAESGIRKPEDIAALKTAGIHAALIGEALMKADDKEALLAAMKGAASLRV